VGVTQVIFFVMLIIISGCNDQAATKNESGIGDLSTEVVAESVGDATYLKSSFEMYLAVINRLNAKGAFRDRLKGEWISKQKFTQMAEASGLDKDPLYIARMANYRRELLSQAFINNQLDKKFPDNILNSQYEARKSEFTLSEIHIAHILTAPEGLADEKLWIKAQQESKKLLAKLKEGKSFERLAHVVSNDASTADRGGDLSWMPLAIAKQRYGDVFDSIEKGKLIGPIRSHQGWHVLLILDESRETQQSFEDVKQQMKEQKRAGLVEELKVELQALTNVQVK